MHAQCSRPSLSDLIRTGHKASVGSDVRQTTSTGQIDEQQFLGQFQFGDLPVGQVSSRYCGHARRRAARLDETAVRVSANIEHAKGSTGPASRIVKPIIACRSEIDRVVNALMVAI